MGTNYFGECKSLGETRGLFRTLAKQLHPDLGGDAATFRAMVEQFQELQKWFWNNPGAERWGAEFEAKSETHGWGSRFAQHWRRWQGRDKDFAPT